MEIVLYFMRLEDKYWGLFLVSLFVLYALCAQKKRLLFLTGFGFLAYLFFLCPLTYRALTALSPQLESYYELSHIELVVVLLCLTSCVLYDRVKPYGKGKCALLLVGVFCLLFFAGSFAYANLSPKEEVQSFFDTQQAQAYDVILEDARERGLIKEKTSRDGQGAYQGQIFIWGPSQLMAKSRMYDAVFCPIYGKDIGEAADAYDSSLVTLYTGYSAYEDEDSLLINKDDQLGAIANSLHLFEQVKCQYVVVYNPQKQGVAFDAVSIFEGVGYTFVGETDTLQIFWFPSE